MTSLTDCVRSPAGSHTVTPTPIELPPDVNAVLQLLKGEPAAGLQSLEGFFMGVVRSRLSELRLPTFKITASAETSDHFKWFEVIREGDPSKLLVFRLTKPTLQGDVLTLGEINCVKGEEVWKFRFGSVKRETHVASPEGAPSGSLRLTATWSGRDAGRLGRTSIQSGKLKRLVIGAIEVRDSGHVKYYPETETGILMVDQKSMELAEKHMLPREFKPKEKGSATYFDAIGCRVPARIDVADTVLGVLRGVAYPDFLSEVMAYMERL